MSRIRVTSALSLAALSFVAGGATTLYVDQNVVPLRANLPALPSPLVVGGGVPALPEGKVAPVPPKAQPAPQPGPSATSTLLKYGLPTTEQLVVRSTYIVNYDKRSRNPHWVLEHVTPASIKGSATRNNTFKEDDMVPAMFRARLTDYVGSGYDRGHLVPAADVKSSQAAMDETFYLTNIAPQVGEGFNRAYWARFEQFVRDLTSRYSDVYVYTGVVYLPQKEADGKNYVRFRVLGDPANTAVPTHFYKVILAENNGRDRVLGAFLMKNDVIDEKVALSTFEVPIETIERGAGFTFFPKLDRRGLGKLCISNACTLPAPYNKNNKKNGDA